jgi:hypothetical protein
MFDKSPEIRYIKDATWGGGIVASSATTWSKQPCFLFTNILADNKEN